MILSAICPQNAALLSHRLQEHFLETRQIRHSRCDVAFLQRAEQLVLLLAVVVLRLAEDAEVRQPVRDVRDHVDLHCGLPLPVLRPVDAPERKLDGGRVDGVDAA